MLKEPMLRSRSLVSRPLNLSLLFIGVMTLLAPSASASQRRLQGHAPATAADKAAPLVFHDVEAQTREFVGYFFNIRLNPEQQALRDRALGELKAVCCDDFAMSSCCCVCNLSRSIWGLSNHLIVDQGYGEKRLQDAVKGWIAFVNPSEFSGQACHVDRCQLPFAKDGCGGMDPKSLVF